MWIGSSVQLFYVTLDKFRYVSARWSTTYAHAWRIFTILHQTFQSNVSSYEQIMKVESAGTYLWEKILRRNISG